MFRVSRSAGPVLAQAVAILLMALAMAGTAATVWASSVTATWTSEQDFEYNGPTNGAPTTRSNVDTATKPGDALIGATKDLLTAGEIACTATDKIYSIGTDRQSVAVVDLANKTLLQTIPLPVKPSGMVYNSKNNKLYVGNYNSNTVSVIDCNTYTIINTITTGNGAYPAVYNPTDNKIYVANMQESSVSIVSGGNDAVISTVAVVSGPSTAAFDVAKDKIYVSNKANHSVSIIDGDSDQLETTVSIEPVTGVIGGQAPGSVGLRVDTRALGVVTCDRMKLIWHYLPLLPSQKILFQVRGAADLASLDAAQYTGPDGTGATWYETAADGSTSASAELNLPFAPLAELQVKLSSDDTSSPDLQDVSLEFDAYPDLTITGVSGPGTGLIGRTIAVSSTAANQGSESAGAFQVGLFLADVNGTGNRYPLCDRTVSSLASGASDSATTTCTIPGTVPEGTYYLQASADYTNQVVEGNENNNSMLGNQITVSKPFPDLLITAVSGPASGTIGSSIAVSTSEANQGNDSAGNSLVGIYLVDAAKGTKTFLCDRSIVSLANGSSDSATSTCTIPSGVATGDYYLQAIADYTNLVSESNETNNSMNGNAITISSVQPDLVVRSVSGTVSGGMLNYTVVVKNQGLNTASYHYTGVYLSTDGNITSADTMLGNTYTYAIAGGASVTLTGRFPVPKNMTGTYYVGAMADFANSIPESDETNNGLAGNQVTISNDLVIVPGSLTGTAANGVLSYSVTVKNNGNGMVGGNYTGIYLSSDPTITSADTILGNTYTSDVAGGATVTLTGSFPLPKNMTGTYYVGAITDFANSIPESDETNNSMAANQVTISNDLVIVPGSLSGTAANGVLSYSVTVKNNGNGMAGGNYTGIYLSSDATITSADTILGNTYTSDIAGGATVTLTGSFPLPRNMTGTYYVGAIADFANSTPESDETNNSMAANQVTISNDLVIVPGSLSGTAANGVLSYSVTVKNNGNGMAGGNYTGIYLSSDATITSADTILGNTYTSDVAGGATVTLTGSFPLPRNMTGTYYVGAIADFANSIPESDETNNSMAANQVTISNDLVIVPGSLSGTAANGVLSYSVTVKNNGNGMAAGSYTGIYLSPDATITSADTILGNTYTSEVAGGATVTLTGSFPLPGNKTGTYYVGAIADFVNSIPESDETNNALAGNQVSL